MYFRILGYGAGKVDDVAAQGGIKPARSDERCKGARSERRLRTLKGQEQSGPLGAGRPNAWAGRHRQAGSERNLEAS